MLASHIRRGNIIIYNGEPHRVLESKHRTPGNLRAFVQAKLRNVKTGISTEARFSSTESVDRAVLEQHEMEYLYSDASFHHFMNTETFDQLALDDEALGDAVNYLVAGCKISVEFYEGAPIGVELPSVVELTVVETTPDMKGATVSASYKPATLETGLVIQVPPFIKQGEKVRVNPNEGVYLARAE